MSNSALYTARILKDVLSISSTCRNFTSRISPQIKLASFSSKRIPLVTTQHIRSLHTTQPELIRRKASSDSIEPKKVSEDPQQEENDQNSSFEPFLIIPNPFKMLNNWLIILHIKNSWDPTFDIEQFKRGAVQAIITVTELARAREWGDLRGLVDTSIIETFRNPKEPLSQAKIQILDIQEHNIDLVRVKDVRVQQVVEQKFVDLFVDILAHKALEEERRDVGFLFQLKFHRNYTTGVLPTWTITGLNMIVTTRNWQ